MLQTLMLIGLGFLSATLIGFLLAPPLWRRSARLATKRVQSQSPLTMAEIQAERDQMRAEFAQTTRKLEITTAELKQKTVDQAVAISRHLGEIDVLSSKLEEKSEALRQREIAFDKLSQTTAPLQSKLKALRAQLAETSEKLEQATEAHDALLVQFKDRDFELKKAEKLLQRRERELARIKKLRAAGKSVPVKQRKKDPRREELGEQIDKLSVQAEEFAQRLDGLGDSHARLLVDKETLDQQKIITHDDAQQYKKAIKSFVVDSNDLRGDIESMKSEIAAIAEALDKQDLAWQDENNNPFLDLRGSLDQLTRSISATSDALAAQISGETLECKAEIEPPPRAPSAANGQARAGDAKPESEPPAGRKSKPGSLAERIRALQGHINQ